MEIGKKLLLKAKVKKVSCHRRKMWVDKKTFLPMRAEIYAKGGKLLKESLVLETRPFGKRIFPDKTVMADKLRKNNKTVF